MTLSKSTNERVSVLLRPGTETDIEEAARIETLARAANLFAWACFPACYSKNGNCSSPDQQVALGKLVQARTADIRDTRYPRSSKQFFVAVQVQESSDMVEAKAGGDGGNSIIVGFVQWEVLQEGTSEAEWQADHSKNYGLPPLYDFLMDINPVAKATIGIGVPHMRLTLVYVHPEYTRQGIGARLVALPLKQADELKLSICVEATPDGGKLYLSLGFEIRKKLSLSLAPYGVDAEPYVNYMMWRAAGGRVE